VKHHDMTAACQQGEVEQKYIKSKCGHSILLDTIMWLTQYIVIWLAHCILDIFLVLFRLIGVKTLKYFNVAFLNMGNSRIPRISSFYIKEAEYSSDFNIW